jgi:aryl-alcohol dehydrogenase-like predicted oxidoreductase
MYAWQFARAQHVAERNGWTRFVSMQNHYNLLYREEEREMIPFCVDDGVGVIPWSPLARGFLTGTRTRGGERRTTRAETVTAPIVGATKLEHLEDALAAADLTLTAEEIARLQEPYVPHPVIGHD